MSAPIVCRRCKVMAVGGRSSAVSTVCTCSPRDLVHHVVTFVQPVTNCGYEGDESGARTSSSQLEMVDCTPCLRIAWAEKEGRELAARMQQSGSVPDLGLLCEGMEDEMGRVFRFAYHVARVGAR